MVRANEGLTYDFLNWKNKLVIFFFKITINIVYCYIIMWFWNMLLDPTTENKVYMSKCTKREQMFIGNFSTDRLMSRQESIKFLVAR
jgi:hypothetical protein